MSVEIVVICICINWIFEFLENLSVNLKIFANVKSETHDLLIQHSKHTQLLDMSLLIYIDVKDTDKYKR